MLTRHDVIAVFVTFPSTYQACVAYKALQNEKSLNIGTKEDYDPRKHLTFASPEKVSLKGHSAEFLLMPSLYR